VKWLTIDFILSKNSRE